MENLTGTDVLSADSLLEYFQPLQKYLERENEKNDEFIGWGRTSEEYSIYFAWQEKSI